MFYHVAFYLSFYTADLFCHSWHHLCLPRLIPVPLFARKTHLFSLPDYWSFSFLLNQSQWHIFTKCNQMLCNAHLCFLNAVTKLPQLFQKNLCSPQSYLSKYGTLRLNSIKAKIVLNSSHRI